MAPMEIPAQSPFSVGVVPQFEARKLRRVWQPILNRLEAATGEKFKLVGSPTIPTFEAEFMDGDFDFAYMNPYHLILAHRKVGYRPLVRDVGRKLFGVLVVAENGGIKEVSDLAGKVIAFPAPNALGASLQ
ncbi:MAG TPA: phosphate ABC transporter, partial [Desulfobacteraceae bacterium]|nr:phosphate ABC transporter [Desulfobacteraceae bacterium]